MYRLPEHKSPQQRLTIHEGVDSNNWQLIKEYLNFLNNNPGYPSCLPTSEWFLRVPCYNIIFVSEYGLFSWWGGFGIEMDIG